MTEDATSPALNAPRRELRDVLLDRILTALTHARRIIVIAVKANAPLIDPETHHAIVEIDRAIAAIATLRGAR